MGRCSVCGNKILYNAFKKVKGIIYCLKCVPKEAVIIVHTAELDFAEFEEAMKNASTVFYSAEELKKAYVEKPKKRKTQKKKSKKVK